MTNATNPEKEQDRVFDVYDHFVKFKDPLFKQQRRIYEHLAKVIQHPTILEAGCGAGIGTAILKNRYASSYYGRRIVGTDIREKNVKFASCLYPWIEFTTWDIKEPSDLTADCVVAVEVFEHVAEPEKVMKNLIDAAIHEVWVTSPNGSVSNESPPSNPYHVAEYTTGEMLDFIPKEHDVQILNWENFQTVSMFTDVNPLVYRIVKAGGRNYSIL